MEHIITSIKGPVLALASKFAAKQEDTTSLALCQFTFFIYDKKKQNRYLVGYDGDWDAKDDENISFKSCLEATYEYIENYKFII